MLSFKHFITESWMYHGSPYEFKNLENDRDPTVIDQAIGSHFAADPNIAKKFATGEARGRNKHPGFIYKTSVPPRSKILHIKQKVYDGGVQSDQNAIASHVSSTVFKEHPHLFKEWMKHVGRGHLSDETVDKIHDHLLRNKPLNSDEFSVWKSNKPDNHESFMNNWDAGLNQQPRPDFVGEVVDKYLKIMKNKGIVGLSYHNTAPMETRGIPQDTHPNFNNYRKPGERGSRKSYIIFEPEHLKLEKIPHENI